MIPYASSRAACCDWLVLNFMLVVLKFNIMAINSAAPASNPVQPQPEPALWELLQATGRDAKHIQSQGLSCCVTLSPSQPYCAPSYAYDMLGNNNSGSRSDLFGVCGGGDETWPVARTCRSLIAFFRKVCLLPPCSNVVCTISNVSSLTATQCPADIAETLPPAELVVLIYYDERSPHRKRQTGGK